MSYRMVRPFCTWGFPINGPFSKFDISTCAAYGGFSAFSGTFPNWTISVGATPSIPPTIGNVVAKNSWSHPVAGAFDVYDYPSRIGYKTMVYVPWEGFCPTGTSTNSCGEAYAEQHNWDNWSRSYIPSELRCNPNPSTQQCTTPDVGWRVRIFSNHDVIDDA